jgi:hypothetical protein
MRRVKRGDAELVHDVFLLLVHLHLDFIAFNDFSNEQKAEKCGMGEWNS